MIQKFLINLITDNIKSFNDAINLNCSNFKQEEKKIGCSTLKHLKLNTQNQIFKIHNENSQNKISNLLVERREINCEM